MTDLYYVINDPTSPFYGQVGIGLAYLDWGGVKLLILNGRVTSTIVPCGLGDLNQLPAPAERVHIVYEGDFNVSLQVEGVTVGVGQADGDGDGWLFSATAWGWRQSYRNRDHLLDAVAPIFGRERVVRFAPVPAVVWLNDKTITFKAGRATGQLTAYNFFLHCLAGRSEYDALAFVSALQAGQRIFETADDAIEVMSLESTER